MAATALATTLRNKYTKTLGYNTSVQIYTDIEIRPLMLFTLSALIRDEDGLQLWIMCSISTYDGTFKNGIHFGKLSRKFNSHIILRIICIMH